MGDYQGDHVDTTPEAIESVRAFGRRVGRSHPTILQAVEDGRIPADCVRRDPATGKIQGIYWLRAEAAYASNTDPTQAERTGASPLNTSRATSSDPGQAAMPPGQGGGAGELFVSGAGDQPAAATKQGKDDPHGYLEHRARTEQFKSRQAELEYLERLGILVPVAEVREATFQRVRMLRDKLLNIPDRVATVIAAERDPSRVHQLLTEELKRVLSELSSDAAAAVAAGTGERVAA